MTAEVPNFGKTVLARGPSAAGGRELEVIRFDKEIGGSEVGECLESAVFMVKEETFRIVVYRNGFGEECRGYLSVFLEYCGEEEEVVVDLMKATVCGVTRRFRNLTFANGAEYNMRGWLHWCSHEDIKKKLLDGILKVKVEVQMKSYMMVVKDAGSTPMIQTPWMLQNLYNRLETYSDFILMCQGQGVPCHRTILEGASPYFR